MIGEKQTKTDLGKIKIHIKAIRSMAAIATMEVDGVLRIYTGTIGKLFDMIGKDSNAAAIKVDLKENNEIGLAVSIVVEYGQDIPKIAGLVQENIRRAIEGMSGLNPNTIDVKIKSIEKSLPQSKQGGKE